jgi:hypothetical protein
MPATTGHKTHGRRDAKRAGRDLGIYCVRGGAPTTQNRSSPYDSGFVPRRRDAKWCTAVVGGHAEAGCRGVPGRCGEMPQVSQPEGGMPSLLTSRKDGGPHVARRVPASLRLFFMSHA